MAEADQAANDQGADKAADAGAADAAAKAVADKAAADAKGADGGDAAKAAADKQAADDKGAADKKAADDKGKGTDDKAAPVDYAAAIKAVKVPEGFTLDEAASKLASDFFTKHKVPADQVQDYIDFYASRMKAGADGNASAFAKQVEGWKATSVKEIAKEDLALAKTTAPKVFDADTMKVVELFGLMDHPGVLKGLIKVGKAIKDDTFLSGDAGSAANGSDARKLFPKSNMNP